MRAIVPIVAQGQFVYDQSMDVRHTDATASSIAAAIGEPARARMLYCLVDGRARTSTELAIVADVSPSTASVHLQRLKSNHLVKVLAQGKHRYYSLDGAHVAAALEALSVLAGESPASHATGPRNTFVPSTPSGLRAARTCYDHIAGALGVSLHDRFKARGWLHETTAEGTTYALTPSGTKAFEALGIDVASSRALRRRFAFACVDWSERRPHIGGALGAALLNLALKRRWVVQELDSRALEVTRLGRQDLAVLLGF